MELQTLLLFMALPIGHSISKLVRAGASHGKIAVVLRTASASLSVWPIWRGHDDRPLTGALSAAAAERAWEFDPQAVATVAANER